MGPPLIVDPLPDLLWPYGYGNGVTLGEFRGNSARCVLGYGLVLFRRLLDDGGEIATAAVLHEDVENASVSVKISVVVSYNVVMMKILENVSTRSLLLVGDEIT